MSLSDLANLGEFVSSIAVLASLIYVAIQVREAKRNQRASMQAERATRISEIMMRVSELHIAAVFEKAAAGELDLTPMEATQFWNFMRAIMISFEDTYLQHREGLLPEMAFEGELNGVRWLFARPGVRGIWKLSRHTYNDDMAAFVDGIIKDTPVAPAQDLLTRWQQATAEEMPG